MAHIYKELEDDSESLLSEERTPATNPTRNSLTLILSFTTAILFLLSVSLCFKIASLSQSTTCITSSANAHSFSDGYATEWGPAKDAIKLQQVTYTSAFKYNDTDQSYYIDGTPKYVGKPSEAIEQAWAELLDGQYLLTSESEAMEMDDPVAIKGYYIAEVEVMHSLHCLNAIRKEIDRDYYTKNTDDHLFHGHDATRRIHVDHCIEQLRQNIQCASDLTPVPLRPFGPNQDVYIGTPMVHTCRNWDTFRDWWTERGVKYGAVKKTSQGFALTQG